jgi:hypothetical protein
MGANETEPFGHWLEPLKLVYVKTSCIAGSGSGKVRASLLTPHIYVHCAFSESQGTVLRHATSFAIRESTTTNTRNLTLAGNARTKPV